LLLSMLAVQYATLVNAGDCRKDTDNGARCQKNANSWGYDYALCDSSDGHCYYYLECPGKNRETTRPMMTTTDVDPFKKWENNCTPDECKKAAESRGFHYGVCSSDKDKCYWLNDCNEQPRKPHGIAGVKEPVAPTPVVTRDAPKQAACSNDNDQCSTKAKNWGFDYGLCDSDGHCYYYLNCNTLAPLKIRPSLSPTADKPWKNWQKDCTPEECERIATSRGYHYGVCAANKDKCNWLNDCPGEARKTHGVTSLKEVPTEPVPITSD